MERDASHGPLRVAHVCWGLEVGGMEKLLVEVARLADPARVAVTFVSLGGRGELAAAIEWHGRTVIAMGEPAGLRPALVPRLASVFRRLRADVVHTHNTRALVYGGPAAKLARVGRLVHTWHGIDLGNSRREALLFRLAGRLPDRVIAVSDDSAAALQDRGIAAARVRRVWNGIDVDRFAYTGPTPGGPIVTVARLSPEKDLQTLLRAVAVVRRHQNRVRLQIAGDGVCMPELRQLAATLGVADSVEFLGQTHDVPRVLAGAGLFVLPSLTEGISLTVLEAMARGLPTVVTRVGGNPEVVLDGATGFLVPPGSPEALADAVMKLRADDGLARRLGLAGRKRVEEHFDVRRMVAEYESIYREGHRPKPRVFSAPLRRRRPHVVSNMPKLADQRDLVRAGFVRVEDGPRVNTLGLWARSWDSDALILDQEPRELALLALLRALLPLPRPPLVSLDLVLSRPPRGWREALKTAFRRWTLRQVDLFLMHLKDTRPLWDCYKIPPQKVRYVPFKVNFLEEIAAVRPTEGDYVFTGGRSRRDYATFCAALAALKYPARIVTPHAAEGSAHGTFLDGLQLPPNVALIHDDGSRASWIAQVAGCKLAVFCISPETISPSGVGAYLLAMALGKCVVVSDCPATRGILTDGENAVLVPMQDPAALRDAVRRAWHDDGYRRRIAAGGRDYARSLGGEATLARNVAAAVAEYLQARQAHKGGV